MIPIMQTKRGGPNVPPHERGDCLSACFASILGLPLEAVDVPHSDDPERHWWDATQDALRPHGYYCAVVDRELYPAGYWLAAVPSLNLGTYDDGRPVSHVVVMRGGDLAHDPGIGQRYEVGTHVEALDLLEAYVLVPWEYR